MYSYGSYTSKEDYRYFNPSNEFIDGFNTWFKNKYIEPKKELPCIEVRFFDKNLCFNLVDGFWQFNANDDVLESKPIKALYTAGFDFTMLLEPSNTYTHNCELLSK